jgi:hypothetical protein
VLIPYQTKPNATFQPAIKLRRDVVNVPFPLANTSRKLLLSTCATISKPRGNRAEHDYLISFRL